VVGAAAASGDVAAASDDAAAAAEAADDAKLEDLLQAHTQAAYSLIGVPWMFGESGPEGGGKKK